MRSLNSGLGLVAAGHGDGARRPIDGDEDKGQGLAFSVEDGEAHRFGKVRGQYGEQGGGAVD